MKKDTRRNIPDSLIMLTTNEMTYVYDDTYDAVTGVENKLFDGNCKLVVVRRPIGPHFDIDFMLRKLYNAAVSCMENRFFYTLGAPDETRLTFSGDYYALRMGGNGYTMVIGVNRGEDVFDLEFSLVFDDEQEAVEEFTEVMNRYVTQMSEHFDNGLRFAATRDILAQEGLERHA